MSNFNKLYETAARQGKTREQLVEEAMARSSGNISEAARELGVTRQGLWDFIRRRPERLAVGK